MNYELKTDRLTLKSLKKADFEDFSRILTNEFVRRYLCDGEILSVEQIENFIADSLRDFARNGYGLWLMVLNESSEIIGFTGLRTFFDENRPQLLYALLPEFVGRGLAFEAAQKVIEYVFLNLNFDYLDASCDAPNLASQRVAERLGMKKIDEKKMEGGPTVFYRLENKK